MLQRFRFAHAAYAVNLYRMRMSKRRLLASHKEQGCKHSAWSALSYSRAHTAQEVTYFRSTPGHPVRSAPRFSSN